MSEHFKMLKPLLGKTWRGTFPNSTPEKPVIDTSRWELALNGKVVRNLHSINDGEYGGETIVLWNAEKEQLEYFYFTTGDFYTHGTMSFEDGKIVSHELVTGEEDGITEVKAVMEFQPDGSFRTESLYLKEGEWVKGHGAHYVEAPGAVVKFKSA